MAGQISIRLTDDMIKRLNKQAKKSKRKRAQIIRAALSAGLDQIEGGATPSSPSDLESMRREVMAALDAITERLMSSSTDAETVSGDPATRVDLKSELTQIPQAMSSEIEVEILPANDASIDETKEPQATQTADFFRDGAGGLSVDGRSKERIIDVGIAIEQRVSARISRARRLKGLSLEEVADALKMTAEMVAEIEAGRREVPHSRGIRVEAKLQQWESEMSETQGGQ